MKSMPSARPDRPAALRILLLVVAATVLVACAAAPEAVDPRSDAPEARPRQRPAADLPLTYAQAVGRWRSPGEVNDWIGARFEYDLDRAMQLSESQRAQGPRVQIHEPGAFFARPAGVCVDLARFAVETLRATAPSARPAYLMIEFDPQVIAGNTLRRHWVVQYEADGKLYYFADSKRPGHVAGPYRTVQEYIEQYAQYRQRRIVSSRALESYERRLRQAGTQGMPGRPILTRSCPGPGRAHPTASQPLSWRWGRC